MMFQDVRPILAVGFSDSHWQNSIMAGFQNSAAGQGAHPGLTFVDGNFCVYIYIYYVDIRK